MTAREPQSSRRTQRFPRHPRYEVIRQLGTGGAGAVFLARDRLEDNQKVALKLSHQEITPREIQREFRILRELRHPGISRAFDCGCIADTGQTYFTMEYVRGNNLKETSTRLRQGSLTRLLQIFVQVAEILEYVHGRGLLHLDIKPANLIVTRGRVTLIDFGIFENSHQKGLHKTRGTALFTAPEIFAGRNADGRADLYSLGATLFYALTGKYPIFGKTLTEIAYNHQHTPPQKATGVSGAVDQLLGKLLAKAPHDRFENATELKNAILDIDQSATAADIFRLRDMDFVGRKRETKDFFHWLEGVRKQSGPSALVLEGEPGVGSSRLLDRFRTELAAEGVYSITLTSDARHDSGGMRRLVEALLVLNPLSRAERSRYLFLLTAIGAATHAPSLRDIEQLDLKQIRTRIYRDAVALLKALDSPCVIIVENFEKSDTQLRDFVRRLGAETFAPGTGVILAHRPSAEVDVLFKSREMKKIRLKGLSRTELLKAASEATPTLGFGSVKELVGRSQGNPGILVRLVRAALRNDTELTRTDDAQNLNRLHTRRIEALSEGARKTLLFLTLFDRPTKSTLLRAMTGLDTRALERTLHTLHNLEFLRLERRGYVLEDPGLVEVVTAAFSDAEITAAHSNIGACLHTKAGLETESAHHLLAGGQIEDVPRAAHKAIALLDNAGRVEEATDLLDRVVEALPEGTTRRSFLEQRADLHSKSGQFDRAREEFESLLEDAKAANSDQLRILRKLGAVHQRAGDQTKALATLEEALHIIENAESPNEHLHILNELAALHLFRKDFAQSRTFANRGLELLGSIEEGSLDEETFALHRLNFHSILGHILLRQFEYRNAAKELTRGLEMSERIGTLSNSALILNNLGVAYHQSNRLTDALRVYSRASTLARKMGDETALFSIQCNVAGIRARRGEMKAAAELLAEVQKMPHSRRSERARMFFLHSQSLVDRLAIKDCAETLNEIVKLADALPDPLFASYGRIYLLENEIVHGRWAHARKIIKKIQVLDIGDDSQFQRAFDSRVALLDALCGKRENALTTIRRGLLDRFTNNGVSQPHHGDLWDCTLTANALIELEEYATARDMLTWALAHFQRSRQHPGTLECALLLAELALGENKVEEVEKGLQQARKALSQHDSSPGSRGAAFRIPFAETRLGLASRFSNPSYIGDRLDDALANLSDTNSEATWLVDLTRQEISGPSSQHNAKASLSVFLKSLHREDRKSYSERDHRSRLGLNALEPTSTSTHKRKSDTPTAVLLGLKSCHDAETALRNILDHIGTSRGAIFLETHTGIETAASVNLDRSDRDRLTDVAFRVSPGRKNGFVFANVYRPDNRRSGVLCVDAPARVDIRSLMDFLELAGILLQGTLTEPEVRANRFEATGLLIKDSEKTRTMIASSVKGIESPKMKEVLALAQRTRPSMLPVLITGESGSGKDHLARWVHSMSTNKDGPFLGLDCSAIPESIVEAELFGYEEGAFTDAQSSRHGYLLAAQSGTLYLDNVDSIPLEVQGKLIRVLETSSVRPLGGQKEIKFNVRVIASSKRDLKDLSDIAEFRSDLYFRLAGICLRLPPLRERVEDIEDLVEHFQRQLAGAAPKLTSSAMEVLKSYEWPGNVRELESLLSRMALTADASVGKAEVVRALGLEKGGSQFPRWVFQGQTYEEAVANTKKEYLLHLFERFDGDLEKVARELGTTKRCVYLRFSRAGIRPGELRDPGKAQ